MKTREMTGTAKKRIHIAGGFLLLVVALVLLFFWNIYSGSVSVEPKDVLRLLFQGPDESTQARILWDIRFPRVLAAMLLGGALSVSGFLLQTFFANPIAGPFVLGISSGAKLMTALVMIFLLGRGLVAGSVVLILASFIGAMLAIPFAIAAASNIVTNRVVVFLVRLFLSLVRTLPTLVCALIATYIFGLGTMAGTCAIAVFTFAYVGKQLFEIIETVDMGPYEAMEALGATKLRAFVTAVFPQVLPTYLSVSLFCLEGNVRYASILGYVGAGGLGLIMNEKIGWREYDSLGMILIVLFVTVMIIEAVSHALRKRLT